MEEKKEGSWLGRLRPKPVDQYFLEEKCPFSQKRELKAKNLKIAFAVVLVVGVAFVLFAGGNAEREWKQSEEAKTKADDLTNRGRPPQRSGDGSVSMDSDWGQGRKDAGGVSYGGRAAGGGSSNRQYSASQIVRGSPDGAGNGFGLPMGSTLRVRLLNKLLSSDASQPVIAEVLEDAVWRNSALIPAGARAMGTASFDDAAKRLQIRFHTFVYPEGDQHPVSALALASDGSSGLAGDYHSGTTQKEVGRFLGNFVGGLADGMKDRQAGGQSGLGLEPGSIKNGILNGVTVSSLDQAKAFSEGMQNVRPYLEVPGGTVFVLYFEKEYSP
ncbi:MAG: TrbI/VirB10 family protein [Deltaproteobacteria bacterium]|nr:TrbI/VirB10 family protein [Deltaproteobacteria bacterium]